MMKKITNSLLFLTAAVFLLGSCNVAPEPGGPAGNESEVEIRFSAPTTYADTRAEADEQLQSMQILVFDGPGDQAEFLYRRTAVKKQGSDKMFRTTLIVQDNVTLRFAANATSVISKASGVLQAGKTWGEIKEHLLMTEPDNITVAAGLPMWAEIANTDIKDERNNSISIDMLRSVASSQIELKPDASEFELEEVWIAYAADKGYLHYSPDQIIGSGSSIEVTKPYSPPGFRNAEDICLDWVKTGDKKVTNIYMYDNAAALYTIGEVKPTKIILKGVWNKAEAGAHSTYYPLTFRNIADEKLQVTRNTQYLIQISRVFGDGFETLAEAKKAEDINLKFEVIPWEINKDTEFIISENKWVSLQSKVVQFPRDKDFRFRMGFSTNCTREDMYIFDKDLNAYNPDANNTGVIIYDSDGNPFCRVLIVKQSGITNKYGYDFRFESLRHFPDFPSHDATMKIKIGRIEFEMRLEQLDKNWGDWESGGTIGWG